MTAALAEREEAGTLVPLLRPFYVTFGVQYPREPHPRVGWAHRDGWLEVSAVDEEQAREITVDVLGPFWAFIYPEPPPPAYAPRGRLASVGPDRHVRIEGLS